MTIAGASHTAHLNTPHRNATLNTSRPPTSVTPRFLPLLLLSSALPADERLDILSSDGGHGHGHGLGRGQPVGVVVAGGEVADIVDVAEHEGHGAEPAQTAAG